MKILRAIGVTAAFATAIAGLSLTDASAASKRDGFSLPTVDEFVKRNGVAAARELNPELSTSEISELRDDPAAKMTDQGFVVFVEPFRTASAIQTGSRVTNAVNIPLADYDTLNSRPESSRTIFLDFDGHTVPSGTIWDDPSQDNPLVAGAYPAFDTNNNDVLDDAEKQIIIDTWAAVAEDYSPFDVNVTTSDPGDAAINRTDASDMVFGTRALITAGNASWNPGTCGCGGIAFLDVFNASEDTIGYPHSGFQPAFVFAGQGSDGKFVSDIASHEVGHNLNLNHDGSATEGAYFQGRFDRKNWAPIMGAGYYNGVVQWSNGEYPNANNPESDLALIAAAGAPLLPDGANNSVATAVTLSRTPTDGIIGSRTDVDWFKVVVTAGSVGIFSVSPTPDTNLDTKLTLTDWTGAAIFSTDAPSLMSEEGSGNGRSPVTGMDGILNATLPNGTYFVKLDGVGRAGNYTDYGSVGQYTISTRNPTVLAISKSPTPTISGTKRRGRTLTLNRGTWTSGTSLSQQWLRDGRPIPGATGKKYVLTTADVGKRIAVRVLGQKSGKRPVLRQSSKTSVITR